MMEYQAPKSKCKICESEFNNKGLARHIKACLPKKLQKTTKGKSQNLIYLRVSDSYNPDYFLHILVAENTILEDLDFFLRGIWLECCGHLSAFSYGRYGDEIDMRKKIKSIFTPGEAVAYQYDFGSTTELTIRHMGTFQGSMGKNEKILLLSRNAPPIIPCDICRKKPAVEICTECQWEDRGWLCEDCAQGHECEESMILPVVNSPRTGVCGYSG